MSLPSSTISTPPLPRNAPSAIIHWPPQALSNGIHYPPPTLSLSQSQTNTSPSPTDAAPCHHPLASQPILPGVPYRFTDNTIGFFVCFFAVLGFELRTYTLSHSASPFFVKDFLRQGLENYWLQTSILLMSVSWVARITRVSHQHPATKCLFKKEQPDFFVPSIYLHSATNIYNRPG
jgi:hypothetical protein